MGGGGKETGLEITGMCRPDSKGCTRSRLSLFAGAKRFVRTDFTHILKFRSLMNHLLSLPTTPLCNKR